jgi:hypothetical protein
MNLPDGLIDGYWTRARGGISVLVLARITFAIAAGTLRQRVASLDSVRAQESWR